MRRSKKDTQQGSKPLSSQALARGIASEIAAAGNADRAVHEKRYLKSELEHFGTRVPAVRRIARSSARSYHLDDRDSLIAAVDALFTEPVHELRLAAVELMVWRKELLSPADVSRIERMTRVARTWALVDPLAIYVVGWLTAEHPALDATIDRWTRDADFWIRRAALLSFLLPLREGAGDFERFARYADEMLEEKEFFIRKAIGWVLRDTGKQRPGLVFDWALPRAHRLSGVTLREVIKPLSAEQVAALLAGR